MKKIVFVCLAVLSIVSCKKENVQDVPVVTPAHVYKNYSNLKVGNYWIYERFNLDVDGNYSSLNQFDSLYVEKDTLINGVTYAKYITTNILGPDYDPLYLRDSLHYTVDASGTIYFSTENFTDILSQYYSIASGDTLFYRHGMMTEDLVSCQVPAGVFVTKNFQFTWEVYITAAAGQIRFSDRKMAEGVGLVYETLDFFAGDPNYKVRKLLRWGHNG